MKNKRRNGDRYYLNLDLQTEGELVLVVGERRFEVWKLVDISPFGAGLSIEESIGTGCKVSLQYQREQYNVNVSGDVLWSEPENSLEEGAGFRLGIHFRREEMIMSASLFKALTEGHHWNKTALVA